MAASRKLTVEIVGDSGSLTNALGRSEKQLKRFGSTSKKQSGLVAGSFKRVAGAAAGVAGAYASLGAAKQAVSTTTDLAKTTISLSKNLGLSTKRASEFAAVLKVRGVEGKQVNQAFGTLAKNVSGATQQYDAQRVALSHLGKGSDDQLKRIEMLNKGAGSSAVAFRKLGVSQDELQKLSPDKLLGEVADGMKRLGPGTERTALSMKLFGKGWQTVVPLLRGGSAAMNETLALATKYGATFGGKTIKSMDEWIQAQREAKLATLGLQVSFATGVVPWLTKGVTVFSKFVAQMRDGKGAGGEFAKTAGDIAAKAKAVVSAIAGFAKAHPGLLKAAAGVAAIGLALKAMKFASSITGLTQVIRAARALGNTKAGTMLAQNISGGLKGVGGRIRSALSSARGIVTRLLGGAGSAGGSALSTSAADTAAAGIGGKMSRKRGKFTSAGKSVGGSAGRAAGSATATSAADTAASNVGGRFSKKRGAFKSAGKSLGGVIGRAAGAAAVVLIAEEIASKLGEGSAQPGGAPDTGNKNYLEQLFDGVFKRGGGFIPGAPSPRDNVPAWLSPGEFVLTGHGQQMVESMAGPGAMSAISSNQAPHFRKGGVFKGGKYTSTSYGPPWGGIQGSGTTKTGVNLKGSPHVYGVAVDPSRIALGSKLSIQPNPFGTPKSFSAFDTGGAIKGNRIDFYDWRGRGKQRGWGRRAVTVARAGSGGTPKSLKVTTPAKTTHPLLGNLLSPLVDDALMGGVTAGREGTSRLGLLTSVLEGILPEAEDYATSRRVALNKASPRGRPGGGGSSAQGKVIARMQSFGDAVTSRNLGYTYGGWHPVGNQRGNPDCSGLVGNILGRGGKAFAARGANFTTDTLKGWGAGGAGRHITVGVRGSTGKNAHTMIKVGGKFYESANSRGKAGRRSGWSGSFPIKRHPPGYRRGGMVGPSSVASRLPGRARTAVMRPGAFDPGSPEFVGWGLRRGGRVEGFRVGLHDSWLQRSRQRGMVPPRRPKKLSTLLRRLSGKPGKRGADKLTRAIGRSTGTASERTLLAAQRNIDRRIRKAAKHGLTGRERIRVRRLRGAKSLVQDALGRPIGQALGASDLYQAQAERNLGGLDDEMILGGVDPESLQGLRTRRARTAQVVGGLAARQVGNRAALARAKRTGNPEAIAAAQGEVDEVDDQIRGLQAAVVGLDKTLADRTGPRAMAEMNLALAGLTDTLVDDAAAQKTRVALAHQELAAAKLSNDPGRIAEAANNLKSEIDAMRSLEEAIRTQSRLVSEMAMAQAGLTATLTDDLPAQLEEQRLAELEYAEAIKGNDKARVIAAANDLKSERDQTLALQKQIAEQPLDRDAALAALTETLDDDIKVAKARVAVSKAELAAAIESGDDQRITEAANAHKANTDALTGLTPAVESNTESVNANTQAVEDLQKEMAKQNEYANAVQSVSTAVAFRGLADLVSGQLGPRLAVQRQSAGSGDVAVRY